MSRHRVVRFLIWFSVAACVLSLSGRVWNKALNLSEGAVGFGGLKEKSQTQAQAHYMMGLFYENQNKFDEAIAEYKQTLALEKDISAARVRIAANLIRKNDFPNALIELQEAKKLDPENIETGLLLTLLYTIQNSSDKAVEEYEFKVYDEKVKMTVSIGLATFPDDARISSELIDKADFALYRAKKMGRNRTCAFGVYK